jgi:hypothetical protein
MCPHTAPPPHAPGKWYALVGPGGNGSDVDEAMSFNFEVVKLPVRDAAAFQANLKRVSPGEGCAAGRRRRVGLRPHGSAGRLV